MKIYQFKVNDNFKHLNNKNVEKPQIDQNVEISGEEIPANQYEEELKDEVMPLESSHQNKKKIVFGSSSFSSNWSNQDGNSASNSHNS